MNQKLDIRRIIIYLAITFGIAWTTALIIYSTGGLQNGLQIAPGLPLALILLALPYMWAPALGNLLTRLITRESWQNSGLGLHLRKGWPYWLAAWCLPAVFTLFGAIIFFVLFPEYYLLNVDLIENSTLAIPALSQLNIWGKLGLGLLLGVLISPLLNAFSTFGEEFGWRAYLLPKLMALGWQKALLWSGLIWGVWHWPVIFMGYEYGTAYPGYPWLGPLLFVWIAFGLGTFLSWVTIRSGSVWPAVIGHSAINGIAAAAVLATNGSPNPLVGPLPVGVIGGMGYALAAVFLFFRPGLEKE